jgi:hypothetical protein
MKKMITFTKRLIKNITLFLLMVSLFYFVSGCSSLGSFSFEKFGKNITTAEE